MSRENLYQLLNQHFNKSELRDLCFRLHIDYENLLEQRKGDLVRELILYCEQRNRLPALLAVCRQERPSVAWPESVSRADLGVPVGPLWQRPWLMTILVVMLLLAAVSTLLVNTGLPDWWQAQQITPEVTPTIIPAQEGEILVLVATFYRAEGVPDAETHNEISRAIQSAAQELSFDSLRVVVDPTILRAEDRAAAEALGERYGASIVIWGEETAARVTVNYLNLRELESETGEVEISVARPDAYVKFITEDLPGQLTFLSLFAVGQSYGVNGDYETAADLIHQAIQSLPPDTEPPTGLAEAYFRLAWLLTRLHGDMDTIIDLYTQSIALSPTGQAYNNRGTIYGRQDRFTEAMADFDQAIELKPDYAVAYSNRGFALYQQKQFDPALIDFQRAIELDPNYVLAYINRAKVWLAQGDTDKALADLAAAESIDPTDADIYLVRGQVQEAQGDWQGALADYDKVITLDPNHAGAYHSRGLIWGKQNDLQQALENFTQAITLAPDYALAYYNRGYTYLQLEQFDLALADFTQALQLNPNYGLAYKNRGIVRRTQGDWSGAVADFQQYLVLEPNAPDRAEVEQWLSELQADHDS